MCILYRPTQYENAFMGHICISVVISLKIQILMPCIVTFEIKNISQNFTVSK